jgi:hypothetical protein
LSIIGNGHSNGNGNGNSSSWWHSFWGRGQREAQDLAAYQRLALQLHYDLPRENGTRSALLVTPSSCQPCATAGFGLALSLGQDLQRPVLLIDAASKKSNVTQMLTREDVPGWSDLLHDMSQPLKSLVIPTSSEHVWFLPSGRTGRLTSTPEDLQKRLTEAQQQYDFVLFSGGSVLQDMDALALLPYAGIVLLLVLENETRTEDLRAAEKALALCKARNVRLVLASPFQGTLSFLNHRNSKAPAGSPLGL